MTKEIPLTKGKVALVDDCDHEWLAQWSWQTHSNGYAVRRSLAPGKRQTLFMHRLILDAPTGLEVDHINGNKLDNRRSNLRLCSHAQNGQNHPGHKKSTTSYKGVSWRKDRQRYAARIMIDGHQIHLGHYATDEDAAKAYDAKARELFGEFARTNFDLE